jgi:hypothetical protein
MDDETRDLLRGSVRALLTSDSADLLAGLAELGWEDVVSDDEAAAVDLLFAEQGHNGVASAALDTVMSADLSGPVIIHPLGNARTVVESGHLRVDGIALHAPPGRAAIAADSGAGAFVLTYEKWSNAIESVSGFAPQSGLRRVRLDLPIDDAASSTSDWSVAVAAGRRALSAELIGNATAMLDLAVEHVGSRTQFGRPIGANQTPRHRLADAYVQVSAANELVQAAWVTRSAWDARMAKAYAGWAAETTAKAGMQVCGAIGLSLEHPLGSYVSRARVLDALYGGWQSAVCEIGEQLLESGKLPVGQIL